MGFNWQPSHREPAAFSKANNHSLAEGLKQSLTFCPSSVVPRPDVGLYRRPDFTGILLILSDYSLFPPQRFGHLDSMLDQTHRLGRGCRDELLIMSL